MSWRESLREASFRGVKFYIDSHEYAGGRRVQSFEFPGRDDSESDDLGRKKRAISLNAFLVGTDYMPDRNALIAALEKEGAAELVHPYLGTFNVRCEEFRISESNSEGGMCRISVSFVEAGQAKSPAIAIDSKGKTLSSVQNLESGVGDFFNKNFSTQSRPSFLLDSASGKVSGVLGNISSVYSKIPITKEFATELPLSLKKLQGTTQLAASTPKNLFTDLSKGFSFLKVLAPASVLKYSKSLFETGKTTSLPSPTTANRVQEITNTQAIHTGSRVLAIAAYSTALVNSSPASVEDAIRSRTSAIDAVDFEMDNLSNGAAINDDDLYLLLEDLRAKLILTVPAEGNTLPHITQITFGQTMPSLVVSYNLYETISMEQDLLDRNRIEHPGFIQGDKTLEVLSRAK